MLQYAATVTEAHLVGWSEDPPTLQNWLVTNTALAPGVGSLCVGRLAAHGVVMEIAE